MPSLVVLVLLYARIASRFSAVQQDAQLILVNLSAFETLEGLIAECDRERDEPDIAARPAPLLSRAVEFSDVSFQYRDTSKSALHALSFCIPAFQVTALIGPSGSGKSTVADILLGLLQPDSGDVTVDGVPLSTCSRRLWRDQTAYVPQDVFLINDTVRANLAFGAPDATEEQMWRALAEARADAFVKRMPEGLDTVLGDRGVLVSGGERQRIALARALIRQPRLLILDEATSAIDWENQALIAQSLQDLRGRITIVTIAHRVSMISFADRVVALESGRIVEQGAYDVLLHDPGSRLSRLVAGESESLK
jgi:ATP-binding cassette subfamily C protein